jgi:hypothetical protein
MNGSFAATVRMSPRRHRGSARNVAVPSHITNQSVVVGCSAAAQVIRTRTITF